MNKKISASSSIAEQLSPRGKDGQIGECTLVT